MHDGDPRVARWAEDYQAGMTASAIARRDRVRIGTVAETLRKVGVFEPWKRGAVTRSGPQPHHWQPTTWREDLPATTVAYIAGIIDGEGTIGHRDGPYDRRTGWRMSVAQLDSTGLCDWLVETTGVGEVQSTPRANRPRLVANWRVGRQADLVAALTATLPYLRVKRARAEEALAALHRPVTLPDGVDEEGN